MRSIYHLVSLMVPRFGSVACGVGKELYVFGGVQSKERENPEQRQMTTCKSEFYHDEMRRSVVPGLALSLLCVRLLHFENGGQTGKRKEKHDAACETTGFEYVCPVQREYILLYYALKSSNNFQ